MHQKVFSCETVSNIRDVYYIVSNFKTEKDLKILTKYIGHPVAPKGTAVAHNREIVWE